MKLSSQLEYKNNMLTPDKFLSDFKQNSSTWESFQGNQYKTLRESWVAAQFLRTYNRALNLSYTIPAPVIGDNSQSVPDIEGCVDHSKNRDINFEIGEVLLDGEKRSEKYKSMREDTKIEDIISNPEAIKTVRSNLLNLLNEKIATDYGKNTFLLIYFNPSCDAGEELFFDKEKIVEGFLNETEFKATLGKNKVFQEIWLLTGRMNGEYSQIICILPNFKIL